MARRLTLDSDDYRMLCRAVLFRDGWKCRAPRCGTRNSLHVHHVVFRSHGGPNIAANLVTLCETCHRRVHGLVDGMTIFIVSADGSADTTPNANIGLKFVYEDKSKTGRYTN